ncbi:MaoC family dehydratase [bacterium]|nr:MAG: MaoC family dehydratase [bacterium]
MAASTNRCSGGVRNVKACSSRAGGFAAASAGAGCPNALLTAPAVPATPASLRKALRDSSPIGCTTPRKRSDTRTDGLSVHEAVPCSFYSIPARIGLETRVSRWGSTISLPCNPVPCRCASACGRNFREGDVSEKPGWQGRCYEDFEVGDVYVHRLGRTVTEVDNIWFTLLTLNTNPIHFDSHLAAQTEFGKPLVDSTFTLALVTGQSVSDISENAIANLAWSDINLPHPVFAGDTIYSRSHVLGKRESKSRPHAGIVEVKTEGFNQDGTLVISFKRTFMVYKRAYRIQPHPPLPPVQAD